jgi:hypothetical protein
MGLVPSSGLFSGSPRMAAPSTGSGRASASQTACFRGATALSTHIHITQRRDSASYPLFRAATAARDSASVTKRLDPILQPDIEVDARVYC